MAAQVKNFHLDSNSKIASKNTSPRTSKMKNMSNAKGEELLKLLIRKRITRKGNNTTEKKTLNDSKKMSICVHNQQNHGGKELLKVVRKGTEKLSMKESKCKSGTRSRMCFCSPTTHEGSFRCRLHRNGAAKKSATDKSNLRLNSKLAHGMMEFKPHLSRLRRVASAEVGPHDSLIQPYRVEST